MSNKITIVRESWELHKPNGTFIKGKGVPSLMASLEELGVVKVVYPSTEDDRFEGYERNGVRACIGLVNVTIEERSFYWRLMNIKKMVKYCTANYHFIRR